jgi:hypothetical protein
VLQRPHRWCDRVENCQVGRSAKAAVAIMARMLPVLGGPMARPTVTAAHFTFDARDGAVMGLHCLGRQYALHNKDDGEDADDSAEPAANQPRVHGASIGSCR